MANIAFGLKPFRQRWNISDFQGMLRFVIALLLAFAAAMKTWQLLTAQYGGVGLFYDARFILIVAVFEFTFTAWLLTGLFQEQTWTAMIALFTLFLLFTLSKALSGAASCGCLGILKTNPWFMSLCDAAIVILLLFGCRNFASKPTALRKERIWVATLFWSVSSLFALGAFFSVHKNEDSKIGCEFIRMDGHKTILVTPSQWSKGDFPLLPYIEPENIRDLLTSGDWRIVIYRNDCKDCRELIKGMEAEDCQNVVLIEVPPYGGNVRTPSCFHRGRLADSVDWLVKTPVVIELFNNRENQTAENNKTKATQKED